MPPDLVAGDGSAGGSVETTVTATTEFAVVAGPLGELLDATVIARQRRRELNDRLAHLAGE